MMLINAVALHGNRHGAVAACGRAAGAWAVVAAGVGIDGAHAVFRGLDVGRVVLLVRVRIVARLFDTREVGIDLGARDRRVRGLSLRRKRSAQCKKSGEKGDCASVFHRHVLLGGLPDQRYVEGTGNRLTAVLTSIDSV